jgi:hypothetical protein
VVVVLVVFRGVGHWHKQVASLALVQVTQEDIAAMGILLLVAETLVCLGVLVEAMILMVILAVPITMGLQVALVPRFRRQF